MKDIIFGYHFSQGGIFGICYAKLNIPYLKNINHISFIKYHVPVERHIGETKRRLATRLKEHKELCRKMENEKSAVAETHGRIKHVIWIGMVHVF